MNNVTALPQMPVDLDLQRRNIPAFILWTACGVINAIASLWILAVLIIARPMTKETRQLVIQMTIVEMLGGLATSAVGSYHLIKVYTSSPETVTTFNCWLIGGFNYTFVVSSLAVFYLSLSCDRFYAAVFSARYKTRSKYYRYLIFAPPWLVPILVSLSTMVNTFNRGYIPLCILRKALSIPAFLAFTDSALVVSICSVLIYILILIVLRCKLSNKSASNIQEIKSELYNKVTRSLAANAILHLLTFSMAAFGTAIATSSGNNNGEDTGPAFVPLYHLGSVTSLIIYIIFQNKFRNGCRYLLKKNFCLSSNVVEPSFE